MVSLSELVRSATPYESREAEFDPRLRIGAWAFMGVVGLYLLMTLLVAANVDPDATRPHFFIVGWSFFVDVALVGGHPAVGAVLSALVLGGGVVLAIQTGGFRQGPHWAHQAALGVALAGLAASLPLLLVLGVCALNLAIWIVIGIVMVVLGVFLVIIFGAMIVAAFQEAYG